MTRALLYALLAAGPLIASDAKTVDAVKNADRAWAAATVKGDAAVLGGLLADDLTYTHSSGDTDSKTVFIGNLKGARKYHKIDYESLDARLYANGTTAVVMAVVRIETSQNGGAVSPAHLRFIHVWVHQKDRWQLAAHQSLRLPS
jgi:ketosteroid isomerase-like protein